MIFVKDTEELLQFKKDLTIPPHLFACAFETACKNETWESPATIGLFVNSNLNNEHFKERYSFDLIEITWDNADYDYETECFIMTATTLDDQTLIVIIPDAPWVEDICPNLISKLHEYTVQ